MCEQINDENVRAQSMNCDNAIWREGCGKLVFLADEMVVHPKESIRRHTEIAAKRETSVLHT